MAKSHYSPDSGHNLPPSVSMVTAHFLLRDAAWLAGNTADLAFHGSPGFTPAAMGTPSIIVISNN